LHRKVKKNYKERAAEQMVVSMKDDAYEGKSALDVYYCILLQKYLILTKLSILHNYFDVPTFPHNPLWSKVQRVLLFKPHIVIVFI
jgi:hypothetical protein